MQSLCFSVCCIQHKPAFCPAEKQFNLHTQIKVVPSVPKTESAALEMQFSMLKEKAHTISLCGALVPLSVLNFILEQIPRWVCSPSSPVHGPFQNWCFLFQ